MVVATAITVIAEVIAAQVAIAETIRAVNAARKKGVICSRLFLTHLTLVFAGK
jgi:hypothetical protein